MERRELFLECRNVHLATWRDSCGDRSAGARSFRGIEQLKSAWANSGNLDQAMNQVYPGFKKISIDFAVMEKADGVVMLESDFDWDDVGEWPAIARHYPADGDGNVFKGEGLAIDAENNLTFSDSDHCITLLGVKDLIVVQSGDATMVCHKDCAQQVKALAQKASEKNKTFHNSEI